MTKRKLSEVFKTVGLPAYTYVKPKHFGEVRADIETIGKHLLIEGPSGIGKTCVVYAVFKDLGWVEGKDFLYVSCRDEGASDVIMRNLESAIDGKVDIGVIVADDFHILDEGVRLEIGSRLKRLSDKVFSSSDICKFILIGIPASGTTILGNARDLGPRLGSYRFRNAEDSEISRLIDEGESAMNIILENREAVLSESNGNFWLAQYICSKICSTNDIHETLDDVSIIDFKLSDIRNRLMSELSNNYMGIATTFAKGKKWRPSGNKPYLEIIVAISKIPDLVIPFDNVLSVVRERRRPGLKAVKSRISEVIFDPQKDVDLRKHIAYEEDYFSLEDPLFRYFLTNLDESDLYRELGVSKDQISDDLGYTYEVGFSFAGEVRQVVEHVNRRLKEEDVITFYDFDQQAFLMAEDLELALPRVYGEACRYYVVFLDENYLSKVWTRFEKDIMTRTGRNKHIIPVILDKEVHGNVVGISSTIGMVDLSDSWQKRKSGGQIGELREAIESRLIQPLLEKISTKHQGV